MFTMCGEHVLKLNADDAVVFLQNGDEASINSTENSDGFRELCERKGPHSSFSKYAVNLSRALRKGFKDYALRGFS